LKVEDKEVKKRIKETIKLVDVLGQSEIINYSVLDLVHEFFSSLELIL
jgi:hypothetical protein